MRRHCRRKGWEGGKRTRANRESWHIQESKLQITVDLGLECDLNVEIQVESEPESVALAAAAALLVDGIACYASQRVGHAADETAGCLPDVPELEVIKRALLLLLLLLALATPPGRGSIVGLLAVRFVDLLLLPLGLLFRAAAGSHGGW